MDSSPAAGPVQAVAALSAVHAGPPRLARREAGQEGVRERPGILTFPAEKSESRGELRLGEPGWGGVGWEGSRWDGIATHTDICLETRAGQGKNRLVRLVASGKLFDSLCARPSLRLKIQASLPWDLRDSDAK